jgi:DNA mismatch endonuclease, patch repair protein
MADIFSKRKRSEVMSKVRSRGNKSTELRLIVLMRSAGIIGWRRCHKLPGSPDFVFCRQHLAIFVDGCFWHCCPKHAIVPATRRGFWLKKLAANKARDQRVTRNLRRRGWQVLRIWEHDLKDTAICLGRIAKAIKATALP